MTENNAPQDENIEYYYENYENNIGCIVINSFSELENFQKFIDETFQKITSEKVKSVIIDLRKNCRRNGWKFSHWIW